MSSTFLYKVTRPAFKPIGDKVCSRTLSSSPCPHRRPYKNIKQMLTGLCQLQALYSSWSLTHLELGCSLSFHRHVIHGMCYVLSVCAKYGIVYWIKKSSLRRATGHTSFHIMLSATRLQSILNVNISELSTHRSHYILTMYLLTILDTYSVQGCQPAHNWIPSFSLCYLRIQVV